jgi:cytochrome c2
LSTTLPSVSPFSTYSDAEPTSGKSNTLLIFGLTLRASIKARQIDRATVVKCAISATFCRENTSDQSLVGRATFNVTPLQIGLYFNKIQCFCFTEERLDPHQKVDMPVVFFVDPAVDKDPEMRGADTITLSYTFFRFANNPSASNLSRFLPNAPPDALHGRELFSERCTGCHALDDNKLGPMLRGVVGRKVGSAPGYAYSQAVKAAGFIWSPDKLDAWLSDPEVFVPGARMPVRVLEVTSRRDIIAYLQQESEDRTPTQ